MKVSDFNYDLPEELIAQVPIKDRSASRLMVLHRNDETIEHKTFKDITNQVTINNSASFKFLTKDLGYINNNSNIKPLKVITSTSKDIIDAQINLDKYLLESLSILDFPTKKDNIYIMNVSVYENSKIKEITLESEDGITWNQQQ